jgi:ribosomal protein L37AE/L43A
MLIWRAKTRAMNSTVSRLTVAAAYIRDPSSAKAEFGAEFRSDVETFIPPEALQACIVPGRYELPPIRGKEYFSFNDPSGGASDSWPTAIAYPDGDAVILAALKEAEPPFSPDNVVSESAEMIKSYGCSSETTGDHYAGEFPRELYAKHGITYRVSERTRSQIYLEFLPLVMSGRVRLLQNKKLISQLLGLERKTTRGGKDSIDHSPGEHDDVANCVAGVCVLAASASGGVLGLLQYEQLAATGRLGTLKTQEWDKQFLFEFEARIRGLQPVVPTEQWKEDPLPGCPACKAQLVTKLSAKEYRCQQCSTQFFRDGYEPRPVRGQRGEYLDRRLDNPKHFRFPGQR